MDGQCEDVWVLTELSELAVGDDQGSQSSQAFESLVAVLFRRLFVNGSTGKVHVLLLELLGLPDEILQEVAVILGQQ